MEKILRAAVERGASDLHIKADDVFRARVDGRLVPLTRQALTAEQTRAIAQSLIPVESDRARLDELSILTRRVLQEHGFDTGPVASPIVRLIVGEPDRAVVLSERLREEGLFVPAIRPPTVPAGSARLRITVTAAHTDEDVTSLSEALRSVL